MDPESFARGGPTFFFDKGKKDPNSTKSGPSSVDDDPTLNAGLAAL